MSARGRAVGFASAAAICAGLAAGAAGGSSAPPGDYGALRPVVVASAQLPARRRLGRDEVSKALEVRRVPSAFVPADALSDPDQALGRRPAIDVPPGGYVLASELAAPSAHEDGPADSLPDRRSPVEITVHGAEAVGGSRRVDVVITTDTGPAGGAGRTYVAARSVRLLGLRPAADDGSEDPVSPVPGQAAVATLALTRRQALALIHAQSFARDVRLIGG